jgi:hypothetical protein
MPEKEGYNKQHSDITKLGLIQSQRRILRLDFGAKISALRFPQGNHSATEQSESELKLGNSHRYLVCEEQAGVTTSFLFIQLTKQEDDGCVCMACHDATVRSVNSARLKKRKGREKNE